MSASALICPFAKQTWGHLMRCFALADALVELGYQVRFATLAEARPRVEGAGFELVELAVMDRQVPLREPRSAREAARARRAIADDLDAARSCIRALAPDIVVADLLPIVNVAAALDAVPSVSVLNLELLTFPLAGWLPAIERVFGELGLPRWAADRVFGDTLLIADMPSATGLRGLPPELAARIAASVRELRFVGPIVGALPHRAGAAPDRARPEVIISLGGGRGTPLAQIVAGCADVDADLVIIVPEASDELARAADERRRSGRGVTILEFVPDFARRLARADALITHGGHGTLALALALAVPTLVIPNSVEQEINAKRLHGVGIVASPNLSALRETIGGLVTALLQDRAGDPARDQLARSFATCGGARDAARAVQRAAQEPPLGGAW